ncbi:N-acetylmuramoyl-L-alanine amidase [Snodgrassella communis]|jgi:N-acetylmuramoyl-L-alanine amidase|uniref:N-acetylmuramoyl-L-alanine amidase AmiC n=1 Tax=Snodgrassella communis TaxID=2946699 RepID=A0A836Z606_9NEIS|nr:N-acetylmuramoyl-L-alanine amidase [Snodgrassella communis]KDN14725.1 N-acetylmuramoyl-L-alanine amidase [Snodgrassella communis]PIT07560.1 N-acetylmuramoyl-L-alanine amidase [Snodgrassella communis]PIT08338.1 N-acetylmuramoyl-L-alanine amidase [Snodgrassella communis]PIT20190.1 N-acetylmuramoyl-L-alanine amidase [Snodgrassella communis]PIT28036.1 N-acetylmuramoyl-L-alanine amidase [Snodgrassella communis]
MPNHISRRKLLVASTGTLLISLTPFARAANAGADIVASRIWPATAYTRMTLESTTPIQFKYFQLKNPDRLVIDIQGSVTNQALRQLSSKVIPMDPYIASIRIGQFNPETIRIVMDLKTTVNPQVFSLAPVANFKNRLVVDLYPTSTVAMEEEKNDPLMALLQDYSHGKVNSDGTTRPQATASTPPVQKTPENKPPLVDRPPISGMPNKLSRQPVIMIDPGHGGEDPGATGPSGLHEKDVVLAIGREVKKILDSYGYKTYMTRNEDIFIPLGVRVAKARKLRADVFVSIHADAFTNPSAKGTGVYALNPKGATSAAAKYLAQTQNAADSIGGVSYSTDKNVNNTLFDLTQTATINDSLKLGRDVLNQLSKINNLHKGSVDQANFAVLKAPDIPSILVETAFISNPIEERLLSSRDFRQKMANSIASGIKDYLSTAVLARR